MAGIGFNLAGLKGWWRRRTTRWGALVALILFGAPALSGLIGRLAKESVWLNDWNALICGAVRAGAGEGLYGEGAQCADIRAAPYVYAPWMARALAPMVETLGVRGIDLMYAALLIPAVLFLFWMGFIRPLNGADWRDRLPFLALLTGSALACGNISYPLHALVALAALTLPRGRVFYVAAVAASCVVKPFFGAFLIVLLLEDRPLARRAITCAWAGALCALAALTPLLAGDPEQSAWRAAIDATVLAQLHQSVGFFGWWAYFGLPEARIAMGAAYLIYAGVLAAAAWTIAERGGLDARARVALGLGLAALLNPRLMDYDLLLLAPAPMLAAAAAPPEWRARLWGAAFTACALVLVFNLADLVPLGMHIAPPAFAGVILAAGVALARAQSSSPSATSTSNFGKSARSVS